MSRKSTVEVRAARAFNLKNYPRAIKHLNELLEFVGESPHTLHLLALCHSRQHDDGQALVFARRALQADDQHLESLKLLARLHLLRDEHSQARLYVARALELQNASAKDPTSSRGWSSTIVAKLRPRRDDASRTSPINAREQAQWLEWAEAFMAAPPESEDDPS